MCEEQYEFCYFTLKVINEAVERIRRTKNFGLDTMNESKNKPDAAGSKQETD